jgi:hypothetical protein
MCFQGLGFEGGENGSRRRGTYQLFDYWNVPGKVQAFPADSGKSLNIVLQGSALIRDETAQRVRDAARQIGYVYNRRAAELRGQSSNIVGVVINDLMNPSSPKCWSASNARW